MSQLDTIIHFSRDGEWHCNNEYRANFIFSPHKRRNDIEKEGIWRFESRPCEHGYKNVRDYKMVAVGKLF